MGKIYYIMGKSASGKDTVYQALLDRLPYLRKVVLYTTRPVREGEKEGVAYHFVTEQRKKELEEKGKIIESRTYQTVYGPWSYFTADDGQIDLENHDYLVIGTLESYEHMQDYFGKTQVIPFYLYIDDGLRLERALARERVQPEPKYAELCRRFLADEEDFKEENLLRCKIEKRYDNTELETCVSCLEQEIRKRRDSWQ